MKTSLARIPTVDLLEARKIAIEMNISISAAVQIHYRKKFGKSQWLNL